MKRAYLAAILTAGGLSVTAAYQPVAQAPKEIRHIQQVKDNLYFISGGDTNDRPTWTGGNTAVLVTATGVVMVDTMLSGSGPSILQQIKTVTDKPVTTIINTHTHFDHSGSNTEFPATVEIVTQENTKANMARQTCAPVTNCDAFKGENAKYLPKRTYKDTLKLGSGKDEIDLYYFGRGHTSGDTWVVFPAVRAVHAGDMFPRKQMPFIDVAESGGSAIEFGPTLAKAVAGIKGVDTVITGHNPGLLTWNDLADFDGFYNDFLAAVQREKKAGKGPAEIASAYKLPDKYKGFLVDAARLKDNVQAIYDNK